VLDIIEYQQGLLIAQVIEKMAARVRQAVAFEFQCISDSWNEIFSRTEWGKRNKPDAIRKEDFVSACDFNSQAGFANPTRADEREQSAMGIVQ
jgi:hypothetical protein